MIAIGTSGYAYPHWRGIFYPTDLAPSRWLEYYSQHFSVVEINLTFYKLPASPVFRHWRLRTPADFQFVLKGSQLISHTKRLSDCHSELAEFFERASELNEKLRCVLWQLPARFSHDPELLRDFLEELQQIQVVFGKVRQAFEFRDPSWFETSIYEILQEFQAAVVLADWPFNIRPAQDGEYTTDHDGRTHHQAHHHFVVPATAPFFYVRRHGPTPEYASAYSLGELQVIARELEDYQKTHDVYLFFNNDAKGYAPQNAEQLVELLQ